MSHAAIDQIDWETLDALADDYESVEKIQKLLTPKVVSQEEIIDRLERLYRAGYVFLTLGKTFDRDALVEEIYLTKDRKFWFGHTHWSRSCKCNSSRCGSDRSGPTGRAFKGYELLGREPRGC